MLLSEIGILLGLCAIMVIAYRRINMVAASIVASIIVCIFSQVAVVGSLTNEWVAGFANFVKNNFLIFAICALFGKVIEDTGCAAVLSRFVYKLLGEKYAVYGCILACTIIIYGGVNSFVAVFTVYPIFLSVFRQANLPRRLLPGTIYAPLATYVSTMLPGSIALPNLIAQQYLGTSLTAAPVVAVVCAVITIGLQIAYLEYEFRKARAKGEGFVMSGDELKELDTSNHDQNKINPIFSFLPFIVAIGTLNIFKLHAIVAVTLGIITALLLYWKNVENKLIMLNKGVESASGALINTAAAVAFGAVVQATAGFGGFVGLMDRIPGSPLISFGLATQLLCGISGSATGGLAIALETLGPRYLAMGINPDILHRVAAISSVGLDTLPHCGLVVTVLTYCKMTHKESYKPIFVVSVIITLIAFIAALILGSVLYPVS